MAISAARKHPRPLPVHLAVCCALALAGAPARAEISDTVHPYVLTSINHDDNLLRQVDNAPDMGDTYKTAEAGVVFERPIGRQIISGTAKVSKVDFNVHPQLNYDGKDLELAWEWHLANHLQGHLGSNYSQTLAPYADFHTQERNLRAQRREYGDAAWQFHPSWQVHGSYTEDRYTFDLLSQRFNNRIEDTSEAGVDYLASSSSRVGFVVRRLTGTYTDRDGLTSFFLDNGYTQDELKASILWNFSGASKLQFLGGQVRRKHAVFAIRDERGFNARLIYDWLLTGKTKLTTTLWREFTAVEGSVLSSSLNKGASLNLSHELSAKMAATASARTERRAFSTVPGIVTDQDLTDATRSVNLGLNYALLPTVILGGSAFRESRSGNPLIGSTSYKANGISFNLSAQF